MEHITVKELLEGLNTFAAEHPEYINCKIIIASESGYSGAGLVKPLVIGIYENYGIDNPSTWIKIMSDDDYIEPEHQVYVYPTGEDTKPVKIIFEQ